MITYVSEQIYVFLTTLYGGIIIGFIYDLYRILRCIFKPKKIATIIEDLIFWIVIAIIAVHVLLFSNDGQLRFYVFLGFLIGAILYNRILSRFVIRGILILLNKLKSLLMKLLRIILFPIKIIKKFFVMLFCPLKKKFSPLYLRMKRLFLMVKIWYRDMVKYTKFMRNKK
ncbi:spore cortex biosynthesis protein YabQ [Crassaminicella indica]|uniref:Spore cortex biosynthesis protein YabQ n=1 Tax=Crassaminicella indica TaxID=2855394 RepID=A0ABX8RFJ6_9CLOT|nr:spore cortex biosynthesis protein YabQ [Crassaminicella indica]QXM07232.1 spore cortex biosynthesis protein YabQ [Crassaminicella indica]